MNKIGTAVLIVVCLIFFGIGYWFWLGGLSLWPDLNHGFFLIGGVGLCLGVAMMGSYLQGNLAGAQCGRSRMSFRISKIGKWGDVLSGLGVLSGITTLMLSFPLTVGLVIFQPTTLNTGVVEYIRALSIQHPIIQIYAGAFIYSLFCLLAFWTRGVVEEGTLLIRGGKILYPGTSYYMGPFIVWRDKIVPIKNDLEFGETLVECWDRQEHKVNVSASLHLDIKRARQRGITHLNYKEVEKAARESVAPRIISEWASTMELGSLLASNPLIKYHEIHAFPVVLTVRVISRII